MENRRPAVAGRRCCVSFRGLWAADSCETLAGLRIVDMARPLAAYPVLTCRSAFAEQAAPHLQ